MIEIQDIATLCAGDLHERLGLPKEVPLPWEWQAFILGFAAREVLTQPPQAVVVGHHFRAALDDLGIGHPDRAPRVVIIHLGVHDRHLRRFLERKGLKVLLAQAFDRSNLPVVAACTEIGDINDDIHVFLRGEPAAVLTMIGGENQE